MTHRVPGGEAIGDTTTKSVTLCLLVRNTEHQQRQTESHWNSVKQERTKGLSSTSEELCHPGATQASHRGGNSPTANIYTITVLPLACQMLSVVVRNNHESKPEAALQGVSLKCHGFVLLKQCFRPACQLKLSPAAVLHCFSPPHCTLTPFLWQYASTEERTTLNSEKDFLHWKKDICHKYPPRAKQDLAV